jgi:hypothetical protein
MNDIRNQIQPVPSKPGFIQMSMKTLEQFGNAMQYSLARSMLAARAGMGFGGARDYYATFGYKRNPDHKDFIAKYLWQDIAGRIINAPVDALWTDHPQLDGGARFNKRWKDVVDQTDLFFHLSRADKFAGLGAYAVLLIGIDDGLPLDQPVRPGTSRNITFLQPYLQGSIEILTLEQSFNSPRFGLPVMYKITPGDTLSKNSSFLLSKNAQAFQVHYTRLLHLADNCLENNVVGHSRLEPVYNTLDDIIKVAGGSAETYWLTANRGMQVDVDKEMELDEDDAAALAAEVDEYSNGLRRVMRTRGVKINSLGSDVADPRGNFNVLIALLSSNTGIPQRVLMGAEAGQLASQQDRANWANRIEERQQNWGAPKCLKPLVAQLTMMGVIPSPINLKITWAEAFKMSPLERGQTSAQQARSITNVTRAIETSQKVGIDVISVEEAREMVAPGDSVLILKDKPVGTMAPKLSAPTNDPKNKLDEIEANGKIQEKAAKTAAKQAAENPPAGNAE